MIKDLHFNFIGFHGSEGYCHLRVAQKSSKSKMIIVCCQYKNYSGTSPTNAIELIAEKFFYDVVNKKIEGVILPNIFKYEKWHRDVNWFDRLLVMLSPCKYKSRFINTYLDIPRHFKEIIWLERYPAGTGLSDHKDDLRLVSMGKYKDIHWHEKPSDGFIKSETGFTISELLADAKGMDLKEIKKNLDAIDEAKNLLFNYPNRQVIWTQALLELLPFKINLTKFATGKDNDEDLWELQIQGLVEEIFNISFPARDIFESEFRVSEGLGLHKPGAKKKCDLVIFELESNKPSVMIELKRASRTVRNQAEKIYQDIVKLLIYSSHFQCDSYLLICGEESELARAIQPFEGVLSFSNNYEDAENLDKTSTIDILKLAEEYKELVEIHGLYSIHTRLIGISTDKTVALWQVSHSRLKLFSNKPYLYRLVSPSKVEDEFFLRKTTI